MAISDGGGDDDVSTHMTFFSRWNVYWELTRNTCIADLRQARRNLVPSAPRWVWVGEDPGSEVGLGVGWPVQWQVWEGGEKYATCTSLIMYFICLPKFCVEALFSVSLGTAVIPRINEKQRLWKILEGRKGALWEMYKWCIKWIVQLKTYNNTRTKAKGTWVFPIVRMILAFFS